MPVAALPGNVRLRAFQLGKQTTFGTPVNATRRFGWRYAPTVDPHWTFPDTDTGTLDQGLPPYRMATDVTGAATGPLAYDDAPYLYGALVKGSVTPSSHVWTYQAASTSQDSFEIFSGEWGDEVAADNFAYGDGVLDSLQLVYPEDLGPIQVTANWRFGSVTYPQTKQVLSVDASPVWAYAADTSLYINDSAATIGNTQLTNTMHSGTVTISNNLDVKRFANGSNTRFNVAGYGRGLRTFVAEFMFAKSTAGIAEAAKWLSANATTRYLSVETISPTLVPTTVIPYSHKLRFAGFWFTRTESTYGTANATITLVCNGYYDPTLAYPFTAIVANNLSSY
jgi:hypothetical protein